MNARRSLVGAAASAALLTGTLLAGATVAGATQPAEDGAGSESESVAAAAARPTLEVPFRCAEKWPVSTRDKHSPGRLALDFNIAGSSDLGRPVISSGAGKVIGVSKKLTSYGHAVEIDHGGGWRTFYAHLQEGSINVAVGQSVSPKTQIGKVGSTGNSTGPHLHYEQRLVVGGKSVLQAAVLSGHPFNYDRPTGQVFARPC